MALAGRWRPYVFVPPWLSASTARAPKARVGRGVSLRVRPTAGCVEPTAPPWRWRPAASLRVHPSRCYASTARAPKTRVGRGVSLRVCPASIKSED